MALLYLEDHPFLLSGWQGGLRHDGKQLALKKTVSDGSACRWYRGAQKRQNFPPKKGTKKKEKKSRVSI